MNRNQALLVALAGGFVLPAVIALVSARGRVPDPGHEPGATRATLRQKGLDEASMVQSVQPHDETLKAGLYRIDADLYVEMRNAQSRRMIDAREGLTSPQRIEMARLHHETWASEAVRRTARFRLRLSEDGSFYETFSLPLAAAKQTHGTWSRQGNTVVLSYTHRLPFRRDSGTVECTWSDGVLHVPHGRLVLPFRRVRVQ